MLKRIRTALDKRVDELDTTDFNVLLIALGSVWGVVMAALLAAVAAVTGGDVR